MQGGQPILQYASRALYSPKVNNVTAKSRDAWHGIWPRKIPLLLTRMVQK